MIIESECRSVDSGDSSHITLDLIAILSSQRESHAGFEEAKESPRNRDSPVGKADPTKDPEFQKVVRHFVTTPPKPHKDMKLGKRKPAASAEASPPKKLGRPKKES